MSREQRTYMLNMGPQHPAMHGVIRMILELEGERIIKSDFEMGYLHRAFEKHAETETWNNVMPWTDRLNYVSPLINNAGYCLAVERLAGIEIPERGNYLRVISSEISRVTDHLTCIGASAMELGAFSVFLYLIKAREYLYQCIDDLTGARITTSYGRIGGVKADMKDGWDEKVRGAFKEVREAIRDADKLLTKNRIFMDRVDGTGVLSREDALAYGVTGPFLRSTGVPYDVRRAHPYFVYDRVNFEVPVGTKGDNFDRYLCRMAEMEQSMRIVEQCFEQIPAGKHSLDVKEMKDAFVYEDMGKMGDTALLKFYKAKVDQTLQGGQRGDRPNVLTEDRTKVMPAKEDTYGSIEGLMNHFETVMWSWGIKIPAGEGYTAVEGGNGELGFYVVSAGDDRPYRVHCRPPCLPPLAAMEKMIEGAYVADIVPTFGSVNMIAGELDR